MGFFSIKNNEIKFHLIFLFILSLYYLIPYLFIGQLISHPHDVLEDEVVTNHIIGRFYRGDFESINLLLGGEIKWYFLWRIFHPLILLYAFFEAEVAFWLTDIIVKLIAYLSFFKLSRKLNCSIFTSSLMACLFASTFMQTSNTMLGLGLAALPYPIYLIIKNNTLKLKHYCVLVFIGLNTDLVRHISMIPIIFFVSWIFFSKYQKYNFKLFIKISCVLTFCIILSNSNLIYSHLFSGPFHRADFVIEAPGLLENFSILIKNFFNFPSLGGDALYFMSFPFNLYIFFITLIGLFSKQRTSYLVLLIIFLIYFVDFFNNLEFISSIKNSSEGLLKSYNFAVVGLAMLPILYTLLFISIATSTINKIKYLIYPLIFLSIFNFQVRPLIIPLGKHFISFDSLSVEEKKQLKNSFNNQKYSSLVQNIYKFRENKRKYSKQNFKNIYTFEGYYDYENYKYIKSLVGTAKTISIGLDPMVANMNNIKTLDGYHNLYPLSYKKKFRKIIEDQLDHYDEYKKYYDTYGQRVYTFVYNPNIIKINFSEASLLGAEYVISKYPISNQNLNLICKKCNGSLELFLYKIKT